MAIFQELAERMEPLATWYIANKPDQRTIRVFAADLRNVRQWPEMAKQVGIEVSERQATFLGLKLIASDAD